MRDAFALQKLLIFFNKKYWHIEILRFEIFNETLINDLVSFEQLGPDQFVDFFGLSFKWDMHIYCQGQ